MGAVPWVVMSEVRPDPFEFVNYKTCLLYPNQYDFTWQKDGTSFAEILLPCVADISCEH